MIEKMEFLRITGPKDDIDRVNDIYLKKYEIHLENAMAELSNIENVKPFVEVNPYKDAIAKGKNISQRLDEVVEASGKAMSFEEAAQVIESAFTRIEDINQKKEDLKAERKHLHELAQKVEPFRLLNYELHKLFDFHFIKVRFGRIAHEYYQKLAKYGLENLDTVFYECDRDETYVWGVYFVPASTVSSVDAVYASMHFERLYIPDEYEGTPENAYQNIRKKIDDLNEQIHVCQDMMKAELRLSTADLRTAIDILDDYAINFDIRKQAACTKEHDQGEVFYILCGWMNRKDAHKLLKEVENDPLVFCLPDEGDEEIISAPPTKLKNPKIIKPFEMFIRMYGLPAYNEMDPTLFIAITYTLMFGIMFGDVGQGAFLVLGGFLLYRLKGVAIAGIISLAGLWSVFFGFMYGSIFGFEDVLPAIWMRPMEDIMTTLVLAVCFGVALILIAMVLHVINAIKAKDWESLFFDASGVSGIFCYGTVVVSVLLVYTGHTMPGTILLAILVGLPLLAIMFKEPLGRILEGKKKNLIEGSFGMYAIQAVVEVFDVVLSYATNTISFVRVGAFALSHAGMMGVVFTLAGATRGDINPIVIILGNIVVMGLEGLVVGIQVLRLEYYEMFSRFYKGTGKEFKPFRKKKIKSAVNS